MSIGDWAFYSCTSLTSITIPNSVTSIGINAFCSCISLTGVTIGNSVTIIGAGAFASCTVLTNVVIPNSVTNIGAWAFEDCYNLTSITIPNSVTSMGEGAFEYCHQLTCVTIGNGVTDIGNSAFDSCTSLTNVTFGNSLTSIENNAFDYCNLTTITIPKSVTSLAAGAFGYCNNPMRVFFMGNAPSFGLGAGAFAGDNNVILYYLPGTTGWSSPIDGLSAVLWNPQAQTSDGSFGVQTNQFGFNITGSSNLVVVVEACTNFANAIWSPVSTNMLNTFVGTNGTSYFSDPQWTNYPNRFYRLRSP